MPRLFSSCTLSAGACLFSALTTPAAAQDLPRPVQIDPPAEEWQVEASGTWSDGTGYGIEALHGVSGALALGAAVDVDASGGAVTVEEFTLIALWRLADPDTRPLGLGVQLESGFDHEMRLAQIAVTAVAEHRGDRWWLQGDVTLAHLREHDARGAGLEYVGAVRRRVSESLWLGVEGSGVLARLDGPAELVPQGEHYAGPGAVAEIEATEDVGLEIGVAWLFRTGGDGVTSGARAFVQASF